MAVDISGSIREMYALAEEKMPFGRYLAPAALLLGGLAVIVGATRYIYDTLLRPAAAKVSAYNGASVGWLALFVLGVVIVVGWALTIATFNRRLDAMERAIVKRLDLAEMDVQLLSREKATTEDTHKLSERLATLEASLNRSDVRAQNPSRGGY
jgi:hypothetical protein